MGKKRGGRRNKQKRVVVDEVADGEAADAQVSSGEKRRIEDTEEVVEEGAVREPRLREDASAYFAHIKQVLEERPFHSETEFEAFVSSTVDEVVKKGLLVLSDPKCSRVVEKLISLLANFVAFEDATRSVALSSSEQERRSSRLRCLDTYKAFLRAVAPLSSDLAAHTNGSHVLQTLLNSVPAVVEFEASTEEEDGQTTEDFFLFILRNLLQDAGDWPSLLSHPTKTHIFRSLVRAAGGVDCLVPVEATGRRKPRKGRRDFEERLIAAPVANSLAAVLKISASNARLAKVPASFDKELKRIARSLTETLRRDPFNLPFNAYASAGLQVLLLVLRATDQEGAASLPLVASNAENARHNTLRRRSSTSVLHATENDAEILQEFLDALLGFPKEKEGTAEDARGGKKGVCEVADALVESPAGSRLLELGSTLLSPSRFQSFFSLWILSRADALAQGRLGNFVLQRILQTPITNAAHVKHLVTEVNFSACLAAGTSGVLWRLADACRRTQSGYREFSRKLFEALGLNAAGAASCVWWSVLTLRTPDSLPPELLCGAGEEGEGEDGEGGEKEKKQEALARLRVQDVATATGCSVAAALLRFPSTAVQILGSGFKKFVKTARDCKVAVKKYKAKGEAPTEEAHVGAFVLTAAYEGSTFTPAEEVGGVFRQVELKRQIVQTLLPLEERLRAENYAAYMKCEVYRYKKNSEEWHKRQEKRNKTREIFKSILESPVAEEVPACEEDAALAAADAIKHDEVARQLVLDVPDAKKKQKSKAAKKTPGELVEDSSPAGDAADEAASQKINEIFLNAFDERQEASRKGKRKLKAQQQAGGSGGEGGAASAESVSERAQVKLPAKAEAKEDPTLEAALFFIEGTRGTLGKRADAKRRREELLKLKAAEATHASRQKKRKSQVPETS